MGNGEVSEGGLKRGLTGADRAYVVLRDPWTITPGWA